MRISLEATKYKDSFINELEKTLKSIEGPAMVEVKGEGKA
jgi:hypothetical protein